MEKLIKRLPQWIYVFGFIMMVIFFPAFIIMQMHYETTHCASRIDPIDLQTTGDFTDIGNLETISVQNAHRLTLLATLGDYYRSGRRGIFSIDSKKLIAGTENFFVSNMSMRWSNRCAEVHVWEMKRNGNLTSINLGEGSGVIVDIVPSPDNSLLFIMNYNSKMYEYRLWDIKHSTELPLHFASDKRVRVAFNPDSSYLAFTDVRINELSIFDISNQTQIPIYQSLTESPSAVAFSPDGGLLAFVDVSNAIHLFNVRTMTDELILEGHNRKIKTLKFSHDGTLLASADSNEDESSGIVRVWDIQTGEVKLEVNESATYTFDFIENDSILALVNPENIIHKWDILTGRKLATVALPSEPQDMFVIRPNPGWSIIAARIISTHEVKLWNGETGEELITISDLLGINDYAFSPDGKLFVTVSRGYDTSGDGRAKLWAVPSD